ncbi:MAG: hypothetical protein HKN76_18555 [Saprospiraceae bacterium]|nr:hypothetical protein [Saprospiraceae bacterium]
MGKRQTTEIFFFQLIVYISIYLWNDHVGFLLCSIFSVITLVLLSISYVVELIEPSKVPRWYFILMWISLLAPALTLLFFIGLEGINFIKA